jgi:hypothetical protein
VRIVASGTTAQRVWRRIQGKEDFTLSGTHMVYGSETRPEIYMSG